MIERYPEGTEQIPYPHTVTHWKDGSVCLNLRVEPGGMLSAPPAPKIDGWTVFFVGHHGDHTNYTYRPTPPPARPQWRRQVRQDSSVLYAMGCCVEDRETLTGEQLDRMWQTLAEDPDLVWQTIAGPAIDALEDMEHTEVVL